MDDGAEDGDVADARPSLRVCRDGHSIFTARDDGSRDNHGSSGDKGKDGDDVAGATS